MSASEDLELVSLTKNFSSGEEDVHFQRKPPRSRRISNTYRDNRATYHPRRLHDGSKRKNFYLPSLCFFAVGLTLWVFVLTWVVVQLRIEMQRLTNITNKVSAGNEAIPDAIQQCHSLTRQLEKNQTKIIDQMQQVTLRLANFSNMITSIQAGLSNVEKKLNDSPELVTSPKTLRSLMSSIATIGGELNDFNITTSKISNEQKKILDQIDGIIRNLTLMNDDIQDLRETPFIKPTISNLNNSAMIVQEVIEKISPNITLVNNTLSNRIQWISDDQSNSQKNINELKDDYQYCKSQIMTIKDDQVNQNKLVKDIKTDSTQMKKDVADFKALVGSADLRIKNITAQLAGCSQACKTESSSAAPTFNSSTYPSEIVQ